MKNKSMRGENAWPFIATAVIAIFLLQGCEPATKHRILSFFFDGVPPIMKETAQTEVVQPEAEPVEIPAATEEEILAGSPGPTTVQHPPYAVKMCYGCHQTTKLTIAAPSGFMLLEEKLKICQKCHDYMSQENLGKTFAWVHAPVQYGACLECHNPHETANPYMMQAWPIRKLCFKCHHEARLLKTMIHEDIDETDCTDCHDPHGSQARYMLQMD